MLCHIYTSAEHSALRSLHHILELQQCLVCCLCICLVHLGHHVRTDIIAKIELGKGIVDIHSLGLWHGCNHVANGCVGGSVVRQSGHTLGITAGNCLDVGLDSCLQSSWVHGCSHDQHFVDGLDHICRALSWQLAVHIRLPVNLLEERVGGLRELLGSIIDLVSISWCCPKHGNCTSCCHRCITSSSWRHKCTLAQVAQSHNCCGCCNEHL